MNHSKNHSKTARDRSDTKPLFIASTFSKLHAWLLGMTLAFALLAGCGGGGGGGGVVGNTVPEGGGDGITLNSITFPAKTDLTGGSTNPPLSAPLAQQVVFTFSGIPEMPQKIVIDQPKAFTGLQIYAVLESDFSGPESVVDFDQSVIPARGIFERFDNVVVFTPYFPTEPIGFLRNAPREAVPGLLPDLEYIVFAPVGGTGGVIRNLAGILPSVGNPVRFTTVVGSLTNLFFQNHPAVPPTVVDSYPRHGDVNVPINTYDSAIAGFPDQKEFFVAFDEPLNFAASNVEGADLDGDELAEDNLLFLITEPLSYAALDSGTTLAQGIYTVDRRSGDAALVGETRLAVSPFTPVGLRSVVFDSQGRMFGCDGATLYRVEYEDLLNPLVCRLFLPRDLGGRSNVRGLCLAPNGSVYVADGDTGSLFVLDVETGTLFDLVELGTGYGEVFDLAVRHDGTLYALAVRDPGTPGAWTTLLRIDLDDEPSTSTVLFSGSEEYISVAMVGFDRLSLYAPQTLRVDHFDLALGQISSTDGFDLNGGLDAGSALDMQNTVAELGTWVDLVENTYTGSRVSLRPSGILPMGARVELLRRRGLANISLGSVAHHEGQDPAEADLIASFTTFDPGSSPVADLFLEDFLEAEWRGDPLAENPSLPAANWPVQDTDGESPEYNHLLATFGLGGGGGLGDFKPIGIFPTVILDTDYQVLPLPDGSTPDIKKTVVVRGGAFNFRDIVIPDGVTVIGVGSNPLILSATGSIEVGGVIDVSGKDGINDVTFDSAFTPVPGGLGGPGGGRGGDGHPTRPQNFRQLTDLRSPKAGETGWGPSNLKRVGGRGGESGADGTNVKYRGSAGDATSRGAGGGGGSFFADGRWGYHGLGRYFADPEHPDRYLLRESWEFDDGFSHPDPSPLGEHRYTTTDPIGGIPGETPFTDADATNDFIGPEGEMPYIQGGQGGGGGGSRLDSMNPTTVGLAAGFFPALDRSAYDAKGGGGGGGGGGLGLYALGEIVINGTGSILARGGFGGGGEVIGHSNFGGGAGGGSGGAVIIDSATRIYIQQGGVIDVSGGWPGEGKETKYVTVRALSDNPCIALGSSKHKPSFCSWSVGDGGGGGHGIVQLQVSDPAVNLRIDDPGSIFAEVCEVDWTGPKCTGNDAITNPHCGCPKTPPNPSDPNCAYKYWHYKINYDSLNMPSIPVTTDCLVPTEKTPSTLGPVSYALSKWIDLGQTVHRAAIGGSPAPAFLGFEGIDPATGLVITENGGYIPQPELNDIKVGAPDWNNGTPDFIPDQNEVVVMFQGAEPVTPGSKVPDPESKTNWTADIHSLSGSQFIRFRIRLDTAKAPFVLKPDSPKPQVEFLRIRMQY